MLKSKINVFVIVVFIFGVLFGFLSGIKIGVKYLAEKAPPYIYPPQIPSFTQLPPPPTPPPFLPLPSNPPFSTAGWKTYIWKPLEFKYPPIWNVKEIYYLTAAEEERGETPQGIGIKLFPGEEPLGNDYVAIGGRQVSCDASENHTKCFPILPIANFIYTDSNNPEILKTFDEILSTFKFIDPQK